MVSYHLLSPQCSLSTSARNCPRGVCIASNPRGKFHSADEETDQRGRGDLPKATKPVGGGAGPQTQSCLAPKKHLLLLLQRDHWLQNQAPLSKWIHVPTNSGEKHHPKTKARELPATKCSRLLEDHSSKGWGSKRKRIHRPFKWCCWPSLNWLFRTREMKLESIFGQII